MLITLAEKITMMEPNVLGRPTTVNITISAEKGIKFMYGVSVRSGIKTKTITKGMVEENNRRLVLVTNPLTGEQVEVSRSDVQGRRASTVSPMPDGLVNVLTKEEILDLIAYLESGGKASAPAFRP